MWSELYDKYHEPSMEEISQTIKSDLWENLIEHLEKDYRVKLKKEYSCCSMQKGWNLKARKSSRSLCTLYPMVDYFVVLIVIGEKEKAAVEELLPTCSAEIQQLYEAIPFVNNSKWLMIDVINTPVLNDVKKLIAIRANKK